jgi:hypothetical protein
MFALTR